MDLLDPKISAELFPPDRSVRTKAHDNAPAKFESGSHVCNSRISGSCRIYGTVYNSILGRGVTVASGATEFLLNRYNHSFLELFLKIVPKTQK